MFLLTSIDQRNVYYKSKAKVNQWVANAKKQGTNLSMDNVIFSPSYLRTEVTLDQATTNYTFGILNTQPSTNGQQPLNVEQRLTLQDSFFVNQVAFGIRVITTSTGNGSYQDMIMRFPSAIFYQMGVTFNNYDFLNLWSSYMSINVNQRVIVPNWDLRRHLAIEQSQASIWSTPPGQYIPYDQQDGGSDGFYPCEPNIAFIGTKDNIVKINLARPLGAANFPANVKINAVLEFRGILAQNSSGLYFN